MSRCFLISMFSFFLLVVPAFPLNANPDQPQVLQPGMNKQLTCLDAPGTVYDLYLPPAYAEETEARFPVLLLHNPSGRPTTSTHQDWAAERGVILVGMHKVSNGMLQHDKPRHWAAMIKDLEAREVRFRKGLWVTSGMSGGSADGERFTRSFPDYACGIITMGVTNVPHGNRRGHIAAGLIIGGKDPFQRPQSRDQMWQRIKEDHIEVYPLYDIGRQHAPAPHHETQQLLDWLLDLGRIRSPQLSETEREQHLHHLRDAMRATRTEEPGEARRQRMAHYLSLPPLARLPESEKIRAVWREDLLLEASRIPNPEERGFFLLSALKTCPFLRPLPEETQQAFRQSIEAETGEAFRKSWKDLQKLLEAEWHAHLDTSALAELQLHYQAFAASSPYPMLKTQAQEAIDRLQRFVK